MRTMDKKRKMFVSDDITLVAQAFREGSGVGVIVNKANAQNFKRLVKGVKGVKIKRTAVTVFED